MKDETKKDIQKFVLYYIFAFIILSATITMVIYLSVFYLEIINYNLDLIGVINVSLITILVLITGAYGYFTWQIVDDQRKSRKVAFIERRLEKLYLLRHNLRCRKIFWVIGDNNRYQLNTDKIKFQFAYLFSPRLKNKLELLRKKLVAADNKKEPKMMPWELPYIKSTTTKTLEILEKDIEIFENDLNDLVE